MPIFLASIHLPSCYPFGTFMEVKYHLQNAHWCACMPSKTTQQEDDCHSGCDHYRAPVLVTYCSSVVKYVYWNWEDALNWLFHFPASCLASMWSAFPWGGSHFWPLTQLVSQCSAVYLQCSWSAPHPDQVEASSVRQQGLILCQPVPRLLLPQ